MSGVSRSVWAWRVCVLAGVLAVGLPAPALADHVVLRNGDQLTGKVVSQSQNDVVFDSELAGRVRLKRDVIKELTTEGAAPAPGSSWSATLNGGLDLSRGNSETATISTNGTVTRLTDHDRFGMYGTYLFSSIGTGADAVTAARAARGGMRYDHDLVGPIFGFGFADAESDLLQLLDLRTVVGGGAGAHVVKTDTTQLNLFGGVSYANDSYATDATATTTTTTTTTPGTGATTGPTPPGLGGALPPGQIRKPSRGGTPPAVVRTSLTRQVAELVAGQDLSHQLSDNISLFESLAFYPAVSDFNDYRVAFDLTLAAQINGWLEWNVNAADRFLNIPPAGGAVQHDVFLSTGIGITFGNGARGAYTGTEGRPPATRKP